MKDNRLDAFSVPIWGFILNDQKYQSRDYLDNILELEQSVSGVKKSNFGGYQTHDRLHEVPVFKEFVSTIEDLTARCYTDYSSDKCKASVTEMWANINQKDNSNGAHIHGQDLSGVFYVNVPPSSGRLVFCNPAVRSDGRLIRKPNYTVSPENLACIIFPSWLEHYVEPSHSNEKRVSISFNVAIHQNPNA